MIKKILSEYRKFWTRKRLVSLAIGVFILVGSLFIQTQAGYYSERKASTSNFVTDLVLDNLPVVNVSFLIIQGALFVILISVAHALVRPRYLLFSTKTIGLLVLTRSIFINLTHLGFYPQQLIVNTANASSYLYKFFDFQGDYFFSGHTALPFLLALIFWSEKRWRWFFLITSAVMGASVLLAHIHYSIDVFAAPFIAYGIFRVSQRIFPHDYALIENHKPALTAVRRG